MRDKPFFYRNGKAAHNVHDLLEIIEETSLSEFQHHVNQEHNDFAAWIEWSMGDKQLADDLRRTTDRIATISILRRQIKNKPSKHFPSSFHPALQKEFLLGLGFGLILGFILAAVLRVIV